MPPVNHFPHLPPYQPPTSGWLAHVPTTWVPYLQLMRLDRPGGLTYFYLPHLFGTLHAASTTSIRLPHFLRTNSILLVGTLLMRGATCTWNDTVDAPFDRQVARTRHRPIARGAVSTRNALLFAGIQSLLAGACLVPLPRATAAVALPAAAGWLVYPLTKRIMDFPQVFLGFPMAWGVFVGAAAMNATSLADIVAATASGFAGRPETLSLIAFFAANAAWTLLYETMYSYQDLAYDQAAGVRSIALLMPEVPTAKTMLTCTGMVQLGLLAAAGRLVGLGRDSRYFAGSVVATAGALAMKIWRVDLRRPESCRWWFTRGGLIAGAAMGSGLAMEYLS